ncbi:DUF5302 domain-containing protein [Microbacterium sp. RD1]|uniref:DUF5302 domain-containing protein n=1 Tax=Microbacterium sp. RD1 TaxID=3457313 RepID=UPI003FA5675F
MSTDDTSAGAASDEVKRKFREALEKKNATQRNGQAHLDGNSAVSHTHGAASTKREFRRKSG